MARQEDLHLVPLPKETTGRKLYTSSTVLKKGSILYPRCQGSQSSSFQLPPGGVPVTKDIAMSLRTLLFGGCIYLGNQEWMKSTFTFREPGSVFGYGLVAVKNNSKAVIMCVQAYILKNLLFNNKDVSQESSRDRDPLRPYKEKQQQTLGLAITDIIWKAIEGNSRCTVCLPGEQAYLERDLTYTPDGLTEKLNLFEFDRREDLLCFVTKYLYVFQQGIGHGVMLLLYSVILSRGIARVQEDLNEEYSELLTPGCEASQSLVTLFLTGRATPYLHNGVVNTLNENNEVKEQVGLMSRGEIGLLKHNRNDERSKELGSRLKTPSFPIWVTCADNHYGVLFNPRRDLIRDHRAEHRFDLHYYNGCPSQVDSTVLTLDTRFNKSQNEYRMPALEKIIITKWQGAKVSWNETEPYI
ncbi:inactive ubiquitin carboxyl-terminal hydrolase MINDY-4B-like [Tachypleus tridentatus]|uniref:inactive ubiquitin carboxyl-terminal hydrolase MINDY-4B-like n=1 Tax=Tachypleus tridentatus TaxID=6853 RepID=UPI003FD61867